MSILVPVTSEAPGICGRYKDRIRLPDEGLPKAFTVTEWADIIGSAVATD